MKPAIRALLGAVLLGQLAVATAEPTLLRFAGVIDGTGAQLDAREILVDEGLVVAVGNDLERAYPAADRVLLEDLFAVPGLIDAHVHMTYALAEAPQGAA